MRTSVKIIYTEDTCKDNIYTLRTGVNILYI